MPLLTMPRTKAIVMILAGVIFKRAVLLLPNAKLTCAARERVSEGASAIKLSQIMGNVQTGPRRVQWKVGCLPDSYDGSAKSHLLLNCTFLSGGFLRRVYGSVVVRDDRVTFPCGWANGDRKGHDQVIDLQSALRKP